MSKVAFRRFLFATTGAVALVLTGPAAANEVDELKEQIRVLMEKVQELESKQNRQQQQIEAQKTAPAPAPANVVTGGDFPGSWKLPGTDTSIKFGGYVKSDFIYDLDQKGGDTQGFPAADDGNPTDLDTGHFSAHARQTRVNLETRTPTDMGPVRTYVEFDFFGTRGSETVTNAHQPRMRHAFGTLGKVLIGQTWGTFNGGGAFGPPTVDFNGPVGQTFIRQAQIRYTHKVNNSLTLMGSIENPQTVTGNAVGDDPRDLVPDFVLRGDYGGSWGKISLSGLARRLKVETGATEDEAFAWGLGGHMQINTFGKDNIRLKVETGATEDEAFAWGLGGHMQINTFGKDNIRLMVQGGDGIGRYHLDNVLAGVNDAFFNAATSSLDTVESIGGWIGYTHWWTDTLRSTANIGYTTFDNPALATAGGVVPVTTPEEIWGGHINLFWSPVPKVNLGLEYSLFHGERENGTDGDISRIQFGAQYVF